MSGMGLGGLPPEAAREGARAAARGESAADVRGRVAELAPGSTVSIGRRGDLVVVTATRPGPRALGLLHGEAWQLSSTATALAERP